MEDQILDIAPKEPISFKAKLIKAIRWVVYIPVCLITLGLIELGFRSLMLLASQLDLTFWTYVIIFSVSGIVWGFFNFVATFITYFTIIICPHRFTGQITFAILGTITFGYLIYTAWKLIGGGLAVIITLLLLSLIYNLTMGIFMGNEDN